MPEVWRKTVPMNKDQKQQRDRNVAANEKVAQDVGAIIKQDIEKK